MSRTYITSWLFVLLISASGFAQNETPTAVTAQNRSGELPFATSVGTDIEQVNVTGGGLHVTIPILNLPGRGMNYNFNLYYDARFWVAASRTAGSNNFEIWNIEQGGLWNENTPYFTNTSDIVPCNTFDQFFNGPTGRLNEIKNFIYHDETGAKHPLTIDASLASCNEGTYNIYNSREPDASASGLVAGYSPPVISVNSLYEPNGTKLSGAPRTFTDVYGNQEAIIPGGVDTLGRVMLTRTDNPAQSIYKVYDSTGTQQSYIVNYVSLPINTAFNMRSIYPNAGNVQEFSGTLQVISSIILPNGLSYQFHYDNYAMITEIDFPYGAVATYTWGNDPGRRVRFVTTRTLTVNGQSSQWTFAVTGFRQYKVTDPLGNETVYSELQPGKTNQVLVYQGAASGTLLREYDIEFWSQDADEISLPTAINTKLSNGLVSRKEFTYDLATFDYTQCVADPWQCAEDGITYVRNVGVQTPRGNVLTVKEYDWGQGAPGPLIRTTTNKYLHETSDNPATGAQYAAQNIVAKIIRQTVTNASGTTIADTQYEYDNLTSTGPYLGSATKVKRWRNTEGAWLAATYAYDSFGNITSITDPLQNQTTWAYDDSWANTACPPSTANSHAYVSQMTNASNQRVQISRFPCTGLIQSHKDENDIIAGRVGTTHTYDLMNRPLVTSFPDGGQTSNDYHADALPPRITDTTKITSSQNLVKTTLYDGLLRPIQTSLDSDPSGTAYELTTYDLLGRKAQVFNPTRCNPPGTSCGETTWGYTAFVYDALGRVTQTTKQDGSIDTVSYDVVAAGALGNCAVHVDEAGKPRRHCSDALGRLIEVDEPNAASVGTAATASVIINGQINSASSQSGVPPPSAGSNSSLNSYFDSSGLYHIFYEAANQHLYDISANGNIPTGYTDLTLEAGAPLAASGSALTFFLDSFNKPHWSYFGIDQHLYLIYQDTSSLYHYVDMMAWGGGSPLAASGSALTSSFQATNYWSTWSYLGSNQHIYEIYGNSSAPAYVDVTAAAGAPVTVAGSALTFFLDSSNTPHWAYIGTNQHVYLIYQDTAAAYHYVDLTTWAGNSPLAVSGSPLTSSFVATNYWSTWSYLSTNQHVYVLTSNGSTYVDVTAAAGAPVAASGSDLSFFLDSGNTPHWVYVGTNQHVYLIYQDSGGAYHYSDMNVWAGNSPLANTKPLAVSFQASNYGQAYSYLGSGQHIYELYSSTSNAPSYADLMATTPLVATDAGTVSLTVSSFTATACFGISSNPACAGQPVNGSAAQVAAALAQSLNSTSSPASATASGSTISMTWLQAGPFSPSVSVLSTMHDNSTLFPNPSFTSSATNFGGGQAPGFDASSYVTLYQYDALGNLLRVDQKGSAPSDSTQWRTRTFTYDSLSRLLIAANPESGTMTYVYDNDGHLLQKASPAPNQTNPAVTQTISYCYDALHRVTGKGYGAQSCPLTSPAVSYTYDAGTNGMGHVTSLTDQGGMGTYSYDAMGRMSVETRTLTGANNAAISKTISYDYNLDGSLKTLHYPSGAAIAYTPDSAGRMLSAVDNGNGINYVTGATYGPDSALTGFVSGSGGPASIANSFSYNKRLQPVTMSATTPSQTVFSIGYDFHSGNGTPGSGNDNGNVYGIYNYRDRTRDQTFTYDPLNRVLSAQNAGTDCSVTVLGGRKKYWGNSYSYDAWGNLLGKNVTKCSAENLSVSADAHNWIHAAVPDYQYDAAGNMTFNASGSQSYTWNQENRLTGAAGYTYTYDGDGNRVIKANGTTASSGTLYWYMTPGVVAESDLAGTIKSEYIFFDGERVARKDFPGNTVAYYFSDHLKTASVITSASGTITADSDYYPWGGELPIVANDANDYKFTGKKRDTETGLDYFGARYYSNGLSRWISADWSATPVPVPYAEFGDPQSLNLYSYVRNVPTSDVDQDGHGDGYIMMKRAEKKWAAMTPEERKKDHLNNLLLVTGGMSFLAGGELALGGTLFRNLLGIGLATAPVTAPIAMSIIEGATPGGGTSLSSTAIKEAFALKSLLTDGKVVAAEFKSGSMASMAFFKSGSNLSVGVGFIAKGERAGLSTTLRAIEQGAMKLAKAEGSKTLTIVAKDVSTDLAAFLEKNGFVQEMKDGKGTGNWLKKYEVK